MVLNSPWGSTAYGGAAAGEHGGSHQQCLLQDQHERRRHDVVGITSGWIEQWRHQQFDRTDRRQRGSVEVAVGSRAMGHHVGGDRIGCVGHALPCSIVQHHVGRIDIGRQASRDALQDVALGIDRDVDNGEYTAIEQCALRLGQGVGPDRDRQCLMRVKHLDELAAERGLVLIDHRDRHIAQDLPQIGLRIVQPVKQRSEDHQTEHVAVGEDAPPFGGKRAGDSAAGRSDDRRLRMPSPPASRRGSAGAATPAPERPAPSRRGPQMGQPRRGPAFRAPPGRTGCEDTSAMAGPGPKAAGTPSCRRPGTRRPHSRRPVRR